MDHRPAFPTTEPEIEFRPTGLQLVARWLQQAANSPSVCADPRRSTTLSRRPLLDYDVHRGRT